MDGLPRKDILKHASIFKGLNNISIVETLLCGRYKNSWRGLKLEQVLDLANTWPIHVLKNILWKYSLVHFITMTYYYLWIENQSIRHKYNIQKGQQNTTISGSIVKGNDDFRCYFRG